MRVVDVWCNLFTPEAMKKYYLENPELKEVVNWWKLEAIGHTIKEFLDILDRDQVDNI